MAYLKTFIIGVLIVTATLAKAQYKPVVFGIRFAPNIGWMKTDLQDYSSEGVRPGYSWGFIADFFIMENYAVQTGFNVINMNGVLKYPSAVTFSGDSVPTFGTLTRLYKFRYIEVPLVFKMQFSASEQSKFFAKIGLGTGFRIKARAEDEFEYDGGSFTEESDISEDVSLVRNSLIIGGGYQLAFKGSTSLIVELVYNDGFIDVLKGNNAAYPDIEHNASNRFLELGVGVIF
jgi:hypothetical protein